VIYPEEADAEWLEKLYCKIKPMTPFKRLYRRRFFLPPNSPLREEVVGDFLPYERWAKRAAAYIACIKLHKLGELGDDLRPVTKVDPLKDQLMADEHDEELSGKGKQCCHKKTSDMKRMEALGDSLLKLATSIFVYGQSTRSRKCTEDWLLSLRMRQICDRNLNRLGKNPELGSTIIDAEFGLKTNYLPPCVTLVAEQNNKRLYQMASDKNTACCVKALAGASLLTSRMAGAMKFLERIGLETTPEGLENNVDPVNGFPRLENCVRLPIPMNGEDELNYLDLCLELEELEAKIKYRFNDKTLLIEALTHPTCYTNRLTVSYQRLAFLGDAVLGKSFCADSLLDLSVHVDYPFQIT
jgi:dsRNA-specific ribonuclease